MTDHDGPPPLPAVQRFGQIEVDTFCAGCHYNLHGQAVTVDDRLNLPVCRCPECGRFHPAGVGVTASGIWVRRMATVLLFSWVGIVTALALAVCFFMGVLIVASVETYADRVLVSPTGQPTVRVNGAVGVAYHYTSVLHPILGGPAVSDGRYDSANPYNYATTGPTSYPSLHEPGPGPEPWLWMAMGSVALGLLAAACCVSLLWHWPRWRYLACLLLPAIAVGFVTVVYLKDDQYQLVRGAAIGRAWLMAGVQGVAVIVGIRVGRPFARAVVRTVIPPKPRQAMAFLWQVDGKTMPE